MVDVTRSMLEQTGSVAGKELRRLRWSHTSLLIELLAQACSRTVRVRVSQRQMVYPRGAWLKQSAMRVQMGVLSKRMARVLRWVIQSRYDVHKEMTTTWVNV